MLSYNYIKNLKMPWKIEIPFMMDSGAYSVILKYGKYPYTPEEYAKGIEKWHPDIAWTMDYPCESSAREKGNYDPIQAQEMTNQNQIGLLDLNVNTQMVVQGWTIKDYLENIDRIKDQGLLTEHLGIGSVCRRGQNKEIARIIRAIHSNVPEWVKLHGFGVKISVLVDTDARFYLYSADSQSWGYENRYGDWLKGEYNGKTWIDKLPDLKRYIARAEKMLNPVEPLFVEVMK
jgi:hypothetical protein